jgi:hypothetical protein
VSEQDKFRQFINDLFIGLGHTIADLRKKQPGELYPLEIDWLEVVHRQVQEVAMRRLAEIERGFSEAFEEVDEELASTRVKLGLARARLRDIKRKRPKKRRG